MSSIFSVRGLSKRFGATAALSGVDFDVLEGEVTGLVGTNGAGKSTLLKIIVGALKPDSGELRLDGCAISAMSAIESAKAGIAMVSQELSLFPSLTVRENLRLIPGGWIRHHDFDARAAETLLRLGPEISLDTPLYRLSLADRQLVEIARALLQGPRVLILDEPTSSLQSAEVERLHSIIRNLRDSGIGVVYVSHFLEDLLDISDNLVVLRGGRRVPTNIVPNVSALQAVVSAMLGEDSVFARTGNAEIHEPLPPVNARPLAIVDLHGREGLVIDEMTVRPGEITGVAGLTGAGIEELFAILFGRQRPLAGNVTLPSGKRLAVRTPDAVKAGVAYTPADRKGLGLALRQSVAENIVAVRTLTLGEDGFVLNHGRLAGVAEERAMQLGIVASSVGQTVGELSGGNQQKVVFAKWIEARPTLLLLDDPTRGVDIGARHEMHQLMRRLARSGMVVVFFSSDPGETVAVCDRVFVFVGGQLHSEHHREDLDERKLIAAMNVGVA